MNGFSCARCGAADLQLASVLYANATSVAADEFSIGVVQSIAGAQCAPPRRPNPGQALAVLLGIPIGMVVLYVSVPMRWSGDAIDLILVGAALYLAAGNTATLWRESRAMRSYQERMERYERTCICLRCGSIMLLPTHWDKPEAAQEG